MDRSGREGRCLRAGRRGCAGSGFRIGPLGMARPCIRLAQDLSLAEHLEEYREVGSFQLLEELANSRDFDGPSY